jgi:hypothetical protein
MKDEMKTATNFNYPSSAAAVVFGGHLSARSRVLGIDRNSPATGNILYRNRYGQY